MSKTVCLVAAILVALVDVGSCRIAGGSSRQLSGGFHGSSTDKNASHTVPDKYITAGSATGLGQYPWIAYLTTKYQVGTQIKVSACGASLISSRHVVTAAHCVDHPIKYYEDVSIYLAEHNTRTFPTDCVGRQCIRNVRMHPDRITIHSGYQRPGQGRTTKNDIAMLRLKGSAPNTDYIRPIRLPSFNINDPKYEGTPVIIAGWGKTEYGQPSATKLHAQVRVMAPNTCRRIYPPMAGGILCAASSGGQGVCFGDSGGPMVVKQGGDFHLVGIMSYIIAECGSPMPDMYTNVYSYLDWIHNAMKD